MILCEIAEPRALALDLSLQYLYFIRVSLDGPHNYHGFPACKIATNTITPTRSKASESFNVASRYHESQSRGKSHVPFATALNCTTLHQINYIVNNSPKTKLTIVNNNPKAKAKSRHKQQAFSNLS